ncbi:flippase [Methanosarcina sp. Mfa9]|uniref:flippase n=1 Tax=Methanosarcina sp. Mfa9 TaxID=3439063 RepID=UPI003F82849C
MSISELKRQSIVSFISRIVYTLFSLLSTMYFAHVLGPAVLGTYFLFISYFSIIDMIGDGGFGRAAIKRISEAEEQDEYYSAFIVLRTSVTILIIVLLIGFKLYITDYINRQLFDWLILAQFVALFYCLMSKGIAGRGKMGIYAVGELTNNISRMIIQVASVFLGYEMAGLVGGFILGFAVAAIIQFKFLDLHIVRFEWKHVKSLTAFSFWLFLTSTGVVLYTYADAIMIGYFLSESSVGIYKVSFQLATFTTLLATVISTTLWPKISHWGKVGDITSIEKVLASALTFSLLMALPIIAGGILLGERMLYFLYGNEFTSGYIALVILLCAQLVNIFQYFFTMYLGAMDRQKESFKVTAVASITNIVLNSFMIPLIGIEGAAISTLVTLGMNAFLAKRILSTIIDIKIEVKSLLNILKATFIMSIFVSVYKFLIPLTTVWLILIPIAFGAIIYIYLILKFDTKICDDLKDVTKKMNLPWPMIS